MDKTDSLLRFITCGSVDDGKSTLIGRLLYDSKTILSDTLNQIEKTSHKRGLSAVDLSLLTDGLQAEREQGITIDVAYRYFSTPTRKYLFTTKHQTKMICSSQGFLEPLITHNEFHISLEGPVAFCHVCPCQKDWR